MKKGILLIISALVLVFAAPVSVLGIEIFFEHRETTELSRGVVYEQNRMMTNRGMLDVHVIFVDTATPYITLRPVYSSRELGLRETTTRLLSDAGAIAGINADFFTMARLHSTYYGPMVRDGRVLSMNARTNRYSHDLAAFFLDVNNIPYFKYMRPTMQLTTSGIWRANVTAYNSIGMGLYGVTVVSRSGMYDTAAIDARIPYLTKFVVDGGRITYISQPGETVAVPENGFVFMITYAALPYHRVWFHIGTPVEFEIRTDINVNFSNIQAAIGGGSVILRNGELIPDGGVAPNARHPRTSVGAMADGRIVLMTVDGRTHSIGVTHAELGAILRRYGVVNAMHMDGGGSTTMVTRNPAGAYSVVNTLSDGSQRRVTNALGVFDTAPQGDPVGIVLVPAENRAIQGVPMPVEIFAVDAFGNRIALDDDETFPGHVRPEPEFINVSTTDGFWEGNRYTPLRTGRHTLQVRFGAHLATAQIEVFSLGQLLPQNAAVNLMEGGRARLRFAGITTDGSQVNIPEVTGLTVTPAYLGAFYNGYFVAGRGGVGYIAASVGTVRAYIPVSVGGFPWPLDIMAPAHGFLSTPPEYVTTRVTTENIAGRNVIRLDYTFARTTTTQASYVTFYPAIEIPGEPMALRLQAYSDGSGHWLRGRVRDYEGNFHNITFIRNAYFTGWEPLTATLPNAPAPFSLDRIYMVTVESFEARAHMARFYGLEALYAPTQTIAVPQGTVFTDRLRAEQGFAAPAGAASHVFSIPNAEAETAFSVSAEGKFAVATIRAAGGGIQAANVYQWRYFVPGIKRFSLPYVAVLMDENPLSFTRPMERELFHLAMTQLRDDGRTVFVVSATGSGSTQLTMRDNIRYINVPAAANASIRFWTEGDRVWWSE